MTSEESKTTTRRPKKEHARDQSSIEVSSIDSLVIGADLDDSRDSEPLLIKRGRGRPKGSKDKVQRLRRKASVDQGKYMRSNGTLRGRSAYVWCLAILIDHKSQICSL